MFRITLVLAALGVALGAAVSPGRLLGAGAAAADAIPALQPEAILQRAPTLRLPGPADSNSPAMWSSASGIRRFAVMTSVGGTPSLSVGASLTRLGTPRFVRVDGARGGVWMEAIVEDADAAWYGFYHNELDDACADTSKMVPHIGAARSDDQGASWRDLGSVLELPSWSVDCETPNRYFTGGVGDFSVVLDADSTYLYVFYSQYPAKLRGQGVAVARLPWADRDEPSGRIFVWRDAGWVPARRFGTGDEDNPLRWSYPIATPIYPAAESWHDDDQVVDAFWGPSVHWNTHLERHVMLLNRARDVEWTNEGIYVAFTASLADPASWSAPRRILEGGRWYPQVIGLEAGSGTDKQAGQVARFFMSGESDHVIQFLRPGESRALESTNDR